MTPPVNGAQVLKGGEVWLAEVEPKAQVCRFFLGRVPLKVHYKLRAVKYVISA